MDKYGKHYKDGLIQNYFTSNLTLTTKGSRQVGPKADPIKVSTRVGRYIPSLTQEARTGRNDFVEII